MKTLFALCTAVLLGGVVSNSGAEPSKDSDREQQQVAALAKEIQAQQAAIAENQTKIDAKLTTIAETLRLARIYAGRVGK